MRGSVWLWIACVTLFLDCRRASPRKLSLAWWTWQTSSSRAVRLTRVRRGCGKRLRPCSGSCRCFYLRAGVDIGPNCNSMQFEKVKVSLLEFVLALSLTMSTPPYLAALHRGNQG
jgi:hypothetical protein